MLIATACIGLAAIIPQSARPTGVRGKAAVVLVFGKLLWSGKNQSMHGLALASEEARCEIVNWFGASRTNLSKHKRNY